jgi:Holliday junction resolvase
MTSAAKRKGSAYERTIVQYLRECGFAVDRTRAGWSDDRGDIHGIESPEGVPFVFECKNQRTLRLPDWIRELEAEIGNAGGVAGVLVHKKHGTTAPEDQYATLPLGMLVQLLKEAGYR